MTLPDFLQTLAHREEYVLYNDNYAEDPREDSQEAGVLVLLTGDTIDDLEVLMEKRTGTMRLNPNCMCFPGGKRDLEDENIVMTAFREAQEEVGLEIDNIIQLSSMGEKVTRETHHRMTPILAWVRGKPLVSNTSPQEVADIVWVKLKDLIENRYVDILSNHLTTPVFFHNDNVYTGVTAEVLNFLLEELHNVDSFGKVVDEYWKDHIGTI